MQAAKLHLMVGIFLASLVCFASSARCSDWPNAMSGRFPLDTSIPRIDTDQDGMVDAWELAHSLNTTSNDAALDPDGDGAANLVEYNRGTDPQVPDGLSTFALSPVFLLQMRTIMADTDGDGMPDAWETANSLNISVNDAALDPDGDGISNLQEYNGGWNPQASEIRLTMSQTSPAFSLDSGGPQYSLTLDTDGDGMPDWWEVHYALNRLVDDSADDPDGDTWSNLYEYQHGTNPRLNDMSGTQYSLSLRFLFDTVGRPADSDGDGMPDYWEDAHSLNRTLDDADADPDGDGRSNLDEYNAGTNPQVDDWRGPRTVSSGQFLLDTGGIWGGYALDSDGDGMPDWWEDIHSLNLHLNDAADDPDGDGISNIQEYNAGTDPQSKDAQYAAFALSGPFTMYTVVDTDGDGIHDAWEVFYFGSTEACDPLGHGDSDGINNYQEFIAGTDPKDAGSLLWMEPEPTPTGSNVFVLSWFSVSNKMYAIERTAHIPDGFQAVLAPSVIATPPMNTYTDMTDTATGPYFYRIRVNHP